MCLAESLPQMPHTVASPHKSDASKLPDIGLAIAAHNIAVQMINHSTQAAPQRPNKESGEDRACLTLVSVNNV